MSKLNLLRKITCEDQKHQDDWMIDLSSGFLQLLYSQDTIVYKHKKLKLANYTSSTGIVLELKTKHEHGRVYCILGQQCSWAFEQSIMPCHLLEVAGVNRALVAPGSPSQG